MAAKKETQTKIYKCISCGSSYSNPLGYFLKIPYSPLWVSNDKYCPICTKCLNEKFEEYRRVYDEVTALIIMCHYLDVPFYYYVYE